MTIAGMRRGAREANEESQAAALGRAVGGLTAFVLAINRLEARVAALEGVLQSQAFSQPEGTPAAKNMQSQDHGATVVACPAGERGQVPRVAAAAFAALAAELE